MYLETLKEHEVIATMLSLALLLAGAYCCGKLFEKWKAPKVVGEIIGGMIFGGSFLHNFFPQQIENIFVAYAEQGKVLNSFYQLGLIFLMFLSGFNTKLDIDKKDMKTISFVFIGATILPIIGALPFVRFFEPYFLGEVGNQVSFLLVFVIGVAITSIPVISKIFFDMGIMNTRFSNMVLTVSTIQDLCLWILLNIATTIASSGEIKLMDMILVVLFTLGMFVIVTLLSNKIKRYKTKSKATDFYTCSFIVLLLCCAILYIFKINIMYSAFLIGYTVKMVSERDEQADKYMDALGNFSFSFFIPIYFALVGIQLNVIHNFSLIRFLVFFVLAFTLEGLGTIIMLQFTKLNRRTVLNFAITMNARGGPGIVLATVAYSYQIINIEFFTVLILTTMLSSLISGYWLRYQQRLDSNVFMNLTVEDEETL